MDSPRHQRQRQEQQQHPLTEGRRESGERWRRTRRRKAGRQAGNEKQIEEASQPASQPASHPMLGIEEPPLERGTRGGNRGKRDRLGGKEPLNVCSFEQQLCFRWQHLALQG